MMFALNKTIFAAFALLPTMVMSANICSLCETPTDFPKRWTYRFPDGRTCKDLYLALGRFSPTSASCISQKDLYQSACCDDAEPEFVHPPSAAPSRTQGDEPVCKICKTDEFPGIPGAGIVARYVGTFSCRQLYWRGLDGLIPGFMCGPLTDYAERVCGCGEFNPECILDETKCFGYETPLRDIELPITDLPTKSPTESPTANPSLRATRAPTKNPTGAPTIFPTETPTKSPTEPPTKSPTEKPTKLPTEPPSNAPTKSPTKSPTTSPSQVPTPGPSLIPSTSPSMAGSHVPSLSVAPSVKLSMLPSMTGSHMPSLSNSPTKAPTKFPTETPTKSPTEPPTKAPTKSPTKIPSEPPTKAPTKSPTKSPTEPPTKDPTQSPVSPTAAPVEEQTDVLVVPEEPVNDVFCYEQFQGRSFGLKPPDLSVVPDNLEPGDCRSAAHCAGIPNACCWKDYCFCGPSRNANDGSCLP